MNFSFLSSAKDKAAVAVLGVAALVVAYLGVGWGVSSIKPRAIITGPTHVARGNLFILDGSASSGGGHSWIPPSGLAVIPGNGNKTAGGSIGVDGRYRFILGVTRFGWISWEAVDVIVGDAPPGPGPGPGPTPIPTPVPVPVPDPVPPPSKYGLTVNVANWSKAAIAAGASRTSADQLGDAYQSISAKIGAGGFSGSTSDEIVNAIKKATKIASVAAMGTDEERTKWADCNAKITAALVGFAQAKTLVTPDDHRAAWEEIGAGFKDSLK